MYSFSFSQLYMTRLLNVQVTLPTSFLPFVNSKPYLNHIFAFVPELRVRRFRHSPTLNIARIFRYEVTGIYLGRETLLDCLAIVPHYRVFVRSVMKYSSLVSIFIRYSYTASWFCSFFFQRNGFDQNDLCPGLFGRCSPRTSIKTKRRF